MSSQAEDLATQEYWDRKYAADDSPTAFDWFCDFKLLKPFLGKHLPASKDRRIIHLGCGNSTLSADMYSEGYINQLSVDFSGIIIEKMRLKHPHMNWETMDVRETSCETNSVDVVIDKGTFDSMIPTGSLRDMTHLIERTEKYINEVRRILKPGGTFLCISFNQPHFIRPVFEKFAPWAVLDVEKLQQEIGTLEYFGWVMKTSLQ